MFARHLLTASAILILSASWALAFGAGGPAAMSHNGDRYRGDGAEAASTFLGPASREDGSNPAHPSRRRGAQKDVGR